MHKKRDCSLPDAGTNITLVCTLSSEHGGLSRRDVRCSSCPAWSCLVGRLPCLVVPGWEVGGGQVVRSGAGVRDLANKSTVWGCVTTDGTSFQQMFYVCAPQSVVSRLDSRYAHQHQSLQSTEPDDGRELHYYFSVGGLAFNHLSEEHHFRPPGKPLPKHLSIEDTGELIME